MADVKKVKRVKKVKVVAPVPPEPEPEPESVKPTNPWILHLREYMNKNNGMSLKQAMNEARASYVPKQKK